MADVQCFVLARVSVEGRMKVLAVTLNEGDAMKWAVSKVRGSTWIGVPLSPEINSLIDSTLEQRTTWEERPSEAEPTALALWDLWHGYKRLDRLDFDGFGWSAVHSTGALSFYDPETGEFYGEYTRSRLESK